MGFQKWKLEAFFLFLSFGGAGLGSILLSKPRLHSRRYKFTVKRATSDEFIYPFDWGLTDNAINGKNGSSENFTPQKTLSILASYPTSIPLLIKGAASQISSKFIYDGYGKTEKSIAKYLKKNKYPKTTWASGNIRHLTSLKHLVLSKISPKNDGIKSIFETTAPSAYVKVISHSNGQSSSSRSKRSAEGSGSKDYSTLMKFLGQQWLKLKKPGYFIHKVVPYSSSFTDSMQKKYESLKSGVTLPAQPNFWFPDFQVPDRKKRPIQGPNDTKNDWEKAINQLLLGLEKKPKTSNYILNDKTIENLKIYSLDSASTPQTNIALRYLSSISSSSHNQTRERSEYVSRLHSLLRHIEYESKNSWSGRCNYMEFLRTGTSYNNDHKIHRIRKPEGKRKEDPMELFCLRETQDKSPIPIFLEYNLSSTHLTKRTRDPISRTVIFYRDSAGFNILYPVSQSILAFAPSANTSNDSSSSYNNSPTSLLLDSFKSFISENFEYLVLKFYETFRTQSKRKSRRNTREAPSSSSCCCDSLIESLLKIYELNHQILNWNKIWKIYDLRSKNNSYLTESLNFEPTTSPNNKSTFYSKFGTIPIDPPPFLEKLWTSAQDQVLSLSNELDSQFKKIREYFNPDLLRCKNSHQENTNHSKVTKKIENETITYWTFTSVKPKSNTRCIKNLLSEYLMEQLSSMKLLQKFLLLPLSFKDVDSILLQHTPFNGGANNLSEILSSDFQNYLRVDKSFLSYMGFSNTNLIQKILHHIEKEMTLSNLSNLSETLIFKALKQSSNLETISNLIKLIEIAPNSKPKNFLNEKIRTLITAIYLMENSLLQYRNILSTHLKYSGWGGYAFTLSWNKYCHNKKTLNNQDLIFPTADFKKAEKEWNDNQPSWWSCVNLSDRLSTIQAKSKSIQDPLYMQFLKLVIDGLILGQNTAKEDWMGYKGFLSSEKLGKIEDSLPGKMHSFLSKFGYISWSKIKEYIQSIQTTSKFTKYVSDLKKWNHSIGTIFSLPELDQKQKKEDKQPAAEFLEWTDLKSKKELLLKFIDSEIINKVNTDNNSSSSNYTSSSSKDRGRFSGLVWNESELPTTTNDVAGSKQYLFSSPKNKWENYMIYLIQINPSDLQDSTSFYDFVSKNITPEMLLADIVKQAQNNLVQTKAINHYLERGSWANGQKTYQLKSSDYFLKDQFKLGIIV